MIVSLTRTAIKKQTCCCNALEHLESSGNNIFMKRPIVCKLCKWEASRKTGTIRSLKSFFYTFNIFCATCLLPSVGFETRLESSSSYYRLNPPFRQLYEARLESSSRYYRLNPSFRQLIICQCESSLDSEHFNFEGFAVLHL